jgi:hypothetical protein
LKAQSQPDPVGSTPMGIAYAEYQQARALLGQADIDVSASSPSLDEDERLTEAMERLDASEWKIIRTRVQNGLDVRLRAMALHQVFLDAEMNSAPTDNRHQMMLAALIYDVFDARFTGGRNERLLTWIGILLTSVSYHLSWLTLLVNHTPRK